jgi:hypothetical protein
MRSSSQPVSTNGLPVVAVNLPWLEGEYGHDFGLNMNTPGWQPVFNVFQITELLLALKEHGISVLRMWLFEQGEGLVVEDGEVIGLDARFESNLRALSAVLECTSQKVYWTLFDMNSIHRNGDDLTRRVIFEPVMRHSFLNNALAPALAILKDSVWGVDVCNEPEGMPTCEYHPYLKDMYGIERFTGGLHWQTVISCLKSVLKFVRKLGFVKRISIGAGYTEGRNTIRRYSSVAHLMSHYDYHLYADFDDSFCLFSRLDEGRSVIIGELGTHSPLKASGRDEWLRIQNIVCERLERIVEYPVEAVFLWYVTSRNSTDPYSLFFNGESSPVLHKVGELAREGLIDVAR